MSKQLVQKTDLVRAHVGPNISSRTHIAFKLSNLYNKGQGDDKLTTAPQLRPAGAPRRCGAAVLRLLQPGWEVLGTAEGVLERRRELACKNDLIVNGICNMEKFGPIKADKLTVVMLLNIQYDHMKNAIIGTGLINN